MNTYEYDVYAPKMEGQNKYRSQFKITEDQGHQVVPHATENLVLKGTDDLALFDTEAEALEAARQAAFSAINGMRDHE